MNKTAPRFSVIIPVYNSEKTVASAIESVLCQSFQDFELILIDDGSTDGSLDICKRYSSQEPRIVLRSFENQGVAIARNRGLSLATGEYVCFLDADDYTYPDWLAEYASGDDADLMVQGYVLYDGSSKTSHTNSKKEFYSGNDLQDGLLAVWQSYAFNSPWKCFKREILVNNGIAFPSGMSLYEDLVFCIRCFQHIDSLCLLPYAGYEYRVSNSVLTRNFNPPELYLSWSHTVIAEAKALLSLGYDEIYRLIAQAQYRYGVRYLALFREKLDKNERRSVYAWLRELGKNVRNREVPRSWLVFKYLTPKMLELVIALKYRTKSAH